MQTKYVKFINHCIFTNMNRVRMVNHTSGNVTYCDRSMIRTLNAIGFVEQPEPSLETEKPKDEVANTAPKTPTKPTKKNAVKS
jgi:hypothetical protein